ncbi:MAG: nitrous oxide reductase family maturation protein NosD [Candidatus Hodarchaeota archaeon]
MKKKIVEIIVCILLIITVVFPSSGTVMINKTSKPLLYGKILYVGGSGLDNFTRIQDAIEEASEGDTVFVYDDSSPYNEFVWINKSINLIGEDKNTTVIDGRGTGYKVVVYITADNVSVTGFTILNCTGRFDRGIFIYESDNVVISGNIIKNNHLEGIIIRLSSNAIIYENTFINNIISIGLNGPQCTIRDNIITKHIFGIYMHNSFNVIENNTIFSPKKEFPTNTWGISMSHNSSNNIVKENTITDHLWGIQITNSYNNIISENTITNSYFSISLDNSSNQEINRNIITNNFFNGLSLKEKSNNNAIVRNTISNSSEYGIYLEFSFYNTIKENNFIENDISAYFENSLLNRWIRNYWDRPRLLPYPIFGNMELGKITIPWFNIDWRPAKEPYDIGV